MPVSSSLVLGRVEVALTRWTARWVANSATVVACLVPAGAAGEPGRWQTPLAEEAVGLGVGVEGKAGGPGPGWAYLTADGREGWASLGLHGRLAQDADNGAGMVVVGVGPEHRGLRASMGGWVQVGGAHRVVVSGGPWSRVELRQVPHGGDAMQSAWLARPELRLDVLAGPGRMVGGPSWMCVGRATVSVGSSRRRVGLVLELPSATVAAAEHWVGPVSPMVGMVVEVRSVQSQALQSR